MKTLPENIDFLKHIEAYQFVVEYVKELCDQAITDLTTCSRDDQPKLVGKLAAYREILDVLEP